MMPSTSSEAKVLRENTELVTLGCDPAPPPIVARNKNVTVINDVIIAGPMHSAAPTFTELGLTPLELLDKKRREAHIEFAGCKTHIIGWKPPEDPVEKTEDELLKESLQKPKPKGQPSIMAFFKKKSPS